MKINSIKEFLSDNQAALIYTPVSRLYLTGFDSSLGYLLITKKRALLFVDGRYIEMAQKVVEPQIEVQLISNISEQVKAFLGNETKTLLVETQNTVAQVHAFEKLFGVMVYPSDELQNEISRLRLVKNKTEIDNIVYAQRMAEKAFSNILGFIRPGVTETDIAAELEYRMKLLGSEEASFATIVVSGEKSSMPHGVPGDRVIKNGDFITMDFGAVYKGYHSDMTRTVAVGSVSDEMKKVYDTVLAANLAAIDRVAEGITAREVDLAARDIITAAGYGREFSHSTGHGVGLEIHEIPTVSLKNEKILTAGQVITIEPGIYLTGKFGVRIEDMVVVAKNGCNNLTKAEKRLIIL